jgi:RNA polymerase sigma-70 factor, ECF subfamily
VSNETLEWLEQDGESHDERAAADGEDLALLRAWRAGDAAAGDELVCRHFLRIHRYFQSKVPAAAEDLAQRTFLACTESRHLEPRVSFRSLLFGIARRLLYDHLRLHYARPPMSELPERSIAELTGHPEDRVARSQHEDLVLRALRELPLDFQTVLELHYWEDMSVAEIAVVVEVAVGTVKSRLGRGRKMLAERIRKMRVRGEVRDSTLHDLVGWTRSLASVFEDG